MFSMYATLDATNLRVLRGGTASPLIYVLRMASTYVRSTYLTSPQCPAQIIGPVGENDRLVRVHEMTLLFFGSFPME